MGKFLTTKYYVREDNGEPDLSEPCGTSQRYSSAKLCLAITLLFTPACAYPGNGDPGIGGSEGPSSMRNAKQASRAAWSLLARPRPFVS
jgi:hypothetical protein